MLYAVLLTVIGLKGLSMQTLKKREWKEISRWNNVYNAKFSAETRLEHGLAVEDTYFQWWEIFAAHYCHFCSLKSILR